MEANGFGRLMRLLLGICLAFAVVACAGASSAFALSPAVETKAATSIGEKGATLNGLVNPNGLETKVYFEYGTTTSYGSKTAEVNVGSGTSTVESSPAISGLSANTTYHYRIVAGNSAGASQGIDRTFTTVGAPAVTLEGASPEESGEAATLQAWVDPNGQATTYQFEYGTESGSYPNVVPIPAESAGSGYEPVLVDRKITGLTPGTSYYWRVSATNASGKVSSTESLFLSSKHPGIQISPVSEVWRTGATLNATIAPHGWTTKYWFEYGTTTSYGTKTATKEVKGEVESGSAVELISGLKGGTVYHYRVIAENSKGTHTGTDQTFTTSPNVTLSVKGTALKPEAPLKAFGTSLKFTSNTGWVHSCQEVELSGLVTENPGAVQSVSTLKMQNTGGAACAYEPSSNLTIKYSSPTEKKTLEYSIDEKEQGVLRTGKFVLVGTLFLGTLKFGECEYNAELGGNYPFGKTPLEATLTGKLELVKATPSGAPCFTSETISGSATVTSSGNNVEASH